MYFVNLLYCSKLGYYKCKDDDEYSSNKCNNNTCESLIEKEIKMIVGVGVNIFCVFIDLYSVGICIYINYCRNGKQKASTVI